MALYTQNPIQKTVHIGLAIDEKLQELKISKTEFGRRIGIPQQNVNRILEKDTIDTGKLVRISEALKFNFFSLYCEESNKIELKTEGDYSPVSDEGDVTVVVGDAVLAERVKSLQALVDEKNERINELKERIEELKIK